MALGVGFFSPPAEYFTPPSRRPGASVQPVRSIGTPARRQQIEASGLSVSETGGSKANRGPGRIESGCSPTHHCTAHSQNGKLITRRYRPSRVRRRSLPLPSDHRQSQFGTFGNLVTPCGLDLQLADTIPLRISPLYRASTRR